MDEIILPENPEEKSEEQPIIIPTERSRRGSNKHVEIEVVELDARSAWPFPMNNQVLIYVDNDYRLMSVNDWPRNMKFKIEKKFFESLSTPTSHGENLKENLVLWKRGNV